MNYSTQQYQIGEKAIIKVQAISENNEISNILTTATTVKIPEKKPTASFKIICKNKEVKKVKKR